jgi:hypothetical protein
VEEAEAWSLLHSVEMVVVVGEALAKAVAVDDAWEQQHPRWHCEAFQCANAVAAVAAAAVEVVGCCLRCSWPWTLSHTVAGVVASRAATESVSILAVAVGPIVAVVVVVEEALVQCWSDRRLGKSAMKAVETLVETIAVVDYDAVVVVALRHGEEPGDDSQRVVVVVEVAFQRCHFRPPVPPHLFHFHFGGWWWWGVPRKPKVAADQHQHPAYSVSYHYFQALYHQQQQHAHHWGQLLCFHGDDWCCLLVRILPAAAAAAAEMTCSKAAWQRSNSLTTK